MCVYCLELFIKIKAGYKYKLNKVDFLQDLFQCYDFTYPHRKPLIIVVSNGNYQIWEQ